MVPGSCEVTAGLCEVVRGGCLNHGIGLVVGLLIVQRGVEINVPRNLIKQDRPRGSCRSITAEAVLINTKGYHILEVYERSSMMNSRGKSASSHADSQPSQIHSNPERLAKSTRKTATLPTTPRLHFQNSITLESTPLHPPLTLRHPPRQELIRLRHGFQDRLRITPPALHTC